MRWLTVWLACGLLHAQTITSVQPTLTVCGEAGTFSVAITNNTAAPLSSPQLQVQLPLGIDYVIGSVAPIGVVELSTTPSNAPKFGLPDIPPQSTFTLTFSAIANCDVLAILDAQNGQVNNTYTLSWGGGNTLTYTTPDYPVLRPALQYLSITNQSFLTPLAPATFSRTFTVRNAGNGRLASFRHKETAGTGITITSATGANIITLTPQLLEVELTSTHFATIGNGDGFFDPNETITFTVDYQVTSCSNLNSQFNLTWGCGGADCITITESGGVAVTASGLVPNIPTNGFPPNGNNFIIINESSCYPDAPGNASRVLFRARNAGTGPAYDLDVTLYVLPLPPFSPAANPIARIDTHNLTVRIGANGALLPRIILSAETGPTPPNNCFTVPDVIRRLTLRVPQPLDPGDTLYVEFDHYTCQIPCHSGSTTLRHFGWEVAYRSGCNDLYTTPLSSSHMRVRHGATLINNHPSSVSNGQTFDLCVSVDGSPGNYWNWQTSLVNSGGAPSTTSYIYRWEIQLPPGVTYTGAPVQWVGILPNSLLYWNATSATQTGSTLNITFTHPNRPNGWNNDAYQNSYVCIPLTFTCGTAGVYNITSRVWYNPNPSCNPTQGYCYGMQRTTTIALQCPTNCPDGMEFESFSFRRVSYGLPDNDNDGVADGSGTLDFTKIRTDRFMVTDTGLALFRGVIRAAGAPWQYAWAHMELGTQGDRFHPVRAEVSIKKASSGLSYQGLVTLLNDPSCSGNINCNRFAVDLRVSTLVSDGVVPNGFLWEDGDAVEVRMYVRVGVNPGNIRQQVQVSPLLYVTNSPGGLGPQLAPHPEAERVACGAQTDAVEIIGYLLTSGDRLITASGCPDPATQVTYHYYLYMGNQGSCDGNLFPYEYRQWSLPTEFRVTLPTGWRYVPGTGQLTHDRTKGTLNNQSTTCESQQTAVGAVEPINPNASTLIFQTSAVFGTGNGLLYPSDDGFRGVLRFRVRPTCAIPPEEELAVPVRITFGGRISQVITSRPLPNGYRLRYDGPRLTIQGIINPVIATQKVVEWHVKVSNTSNVSAAPYALLFFDAPNGGLTVTQVIDAATNAPIPLTNGYYPIGTIPAGGDRYFYVRATINSCPDTLIAYVGWDCQGYPNPLSTLPCLSSAPFVKLTFTPADPLPLASVTIAPNPADLCDTLTVEATITNGGNGYAYNPTLFFLLPPGMVYVTSSAEYEYPVNAGWASLPDPNAFFILRYWSLGTHVPALADGLPHVGNDAIKVRFRVVTNCSYVSGSQIRFYTLAQTVCGAIRYQVATPSVFSLTNVVTPYQATLSGPDIVVSQCRGVYTYTVTLTNQGAGSTGTDDSVRVVIPQGIYITNSTTAILNFTPHEPVITYSGGNTILTWGLNSGVPMGGQIQFSFQFSVAPTLPHGSYSIAIQSLINATRACGSNGSCNIFYPTGNAATLLDVQRPVGLWTGAINSDWFEPDNWGDCAVPTCATDVTIQPAPNQPVINDIASCRNLTIQTGSLLTLTNIGRIDICGDYWLQNGATLTANANSQMRFVGATDQRYKKEGTGDPYHFEMAQTVPGRRLILQSPLTIEGNLTLTMGVIDGYAQGYETFVKQPSASAVSIGSPNSYISGHLRRNLNTSARDGWYYLPVGHLPSGKGYQRGEIYFDAAPQFPQILAYFLPWPTNPPPTSVNQVDCGAQFGMMPNLDNGYWVIDRIGGAPTSYHIRLYARNYTNATGQGFAVVKRENGSPTLFDFYGACEGTPYDRADQTGRLQVPDFSEFAIAQSPVPLAVQFIYVRGIPRERHAEVSYAVRQDWSLTHFHEIERSVDGRLWEPIGRLLPETFLRKDGEIGYYTWKDYAVEEGKKYFYRVRVQEYSGSTYLSPAVEVLIGAADQLWATIVPNPSTTEAWLELSRGGYPVRIWTPTGALVWEGYAQSERMLLPHAELSAGAYIVEVGERRLRWIKQ